MPGLMDACESVYQHSCLSYQLYSHQKLQATAGAVVVAGTVVWTR